MSSFVLTERLEGVPSPAKLHFRKTIRPREWRRAKEVWSALCGYTDHLNDRFMGIDPDPDNLPDMCPACRNLYLRCQ